MAKGMYPTVQMVFLSEKAKTINSFFLMRLKINRKKKKKSNQITLKIQVKKIRKYSRKKNLLNIMKKQKAFQY